MRLGALPLVVLLFVLLPGRLSAAPRDTFREPTVSRTAQDRPERRGGPRADLARARMLYNAANYDAAIELATALRGSAVADEAALVLARARLERYRRTGDLDELGAARRELIRIDLGGLSPRERIEYEVGLAEALFLERVFGAAAEMFASLLVRAAALGPRAADRVLDWWATALDHHAQTLAPADRDGVYRRVLTRMEDELTRDPASAPAYYWIAAAARALGQLDRAWDAAIAAWVRAPLTREASGALRADIDRLVVGALVPERARRIAARHRTGANAGPPRTVEDVAASLGDEWQAVKERWSRP